jgi:outer membrane protein assembly factor BamE
VKSVRLLFLLVPLLAALGGCGSNFGFPGVYRINVEQGNIVTEDMVAQLKEGMSRRQVRFIMGTPLIEDTFHADRWDYRYLLRNGDETLRERHVIVEFDGDSLVSVEGDIKPVWAGGTAGLETDEEAAESAENDADGEESEAGGAEG